MTKREMRSLLDLIDEALTEAAPFVADGLGDETICIRAARAQEAIRAAQQARRKLLAVAVGDDKLVNKEPLA